MLPVFEMRSQRSQLVKKTRATATWKDRLLIAFAAADTAVVWLAVMANSARRCEIQSKTRRVLYSTGWCNTWSLI